jgi:hypothetical protein
MILALNSDFQNFTFKYSNSTGHAEWFDFFCFSIQCCTDLCESTLAGKVAALCMACKGTKSGVFQV